MRIRHEALLTGESDPIVKHPDDGVLSGAIVVAFTPPSIPGLSRFGGFEFQVLDQTGTNIQTLADGTQGIIGAANRSPDESVAAAGAFSRQAESRTSDAASVMTRLREYMAGFPV